MSIIIHRFGPYNCNLVSLVFEYLEIAIKSLVSFFLVILWTKLFKKNTLKTKLTT